MSSFSLDSFGFVNFWHQNIGEKGAKAYTIFEKKSCS